MVAGLVIGGILVVLIIVWISMYNSLVKYKNWSEESWAQIDVQLKRRYDLIPNLIETTKGYAKYEKETLDAVIQARNSILSNGNLSREETMQANDQLSGTLKSLFALSESYPDLKASENFRVLQEELIQTENKISYARQLYNKTTNEYNIKIQTVPSNIIAGIHKFQKINLLETPAEERHNIKVQF